jgi:hypothetical protein
VAHQPFQALLAALTRGAAVAQRATEGTAVLRAGSGILITLCVAVAIAAYGLALPGGTNTILGACGAVFGGAVAIAAQRGYSKRPAGAVAIAAHHWAVLRAGAGVLANCKITIPITARAPNSSTTQVPAVIQAGHAGLAACNDAETIAARDILAVAAAWAVLRAGFACLIAARKTHAIPTNIL